MLEVYVIRQCSTGLYMPPLKSGKRGATRAAFGVEPRIFYRRQDAVCALGWYLNGERYQVRGYDSQCGEYYEDCHTRKKPGRLPSDYSIEPMLLVKLP